MTFARDSRPLLDVQGRVSASIEQSGRMARPTVFFPFLVATKRQNAPRAFVVAN